MGELKFSAKYDLNKKTAANAIIKRYFSEHIVKCSIQAAILLVLGVLFAVTAIAQGDGMSRFLCIVCVVAIAMVFYMPVSQAKMQAARFENGVDFELSLFENGICITRGENQTQMPFEEISKALELEDFFYIESKKRFFPVPKSSFEQAQITQISQTLSNNLSERVKKRTK